MASNRRRLLRLIDRAAGGPLAERFARSDIGLAIEPMPRDGWHVRIGDPGSGYTLERWCQSRHEAADWLTRIADSLG